MGVYGFARLLLPLCPNEIRIHRPLAAGAGGYARLFAPLQRGPSRSLKKNVEVRVRSTILGYLHAWLVAVAVSSACAAIRQRQGGR